MKKALYSAKKKGKKPEKEAAHLPVARTAWSTAPAQFKSWHRCHDQLVEAAAAYVPATNTGPSRLALIGDSITESWRGTSICRSIGRCRGVPDVLAETLGKRWPQPVVLGIAADHTQHLLWRLEQGELSAAMKADPKLISVLLIGTNNLGRGHTAEETLAGIDAVIEMLLTKTRGRLLVNALFPRGDAAKRKYADTKVGVTADGAPTHTDRTESCRSFSCWRDRRIAGRPIKSFAPLIARVNAALNASVAQTARRYAGRVGYVACGESYALGNSVHTELMPDTLHPNARGYQLWAACLTPAVTALEQQPLLALAPPA